MISLLHKNKGFTLIEIIIVLLIIGILASISIPAYFTWLKKNKAPEALATINSIKSQVVPCLRAHVGSEPSCFAGVTTIPGFLCFYAPGICYDFNASQNFSYHVITTYCTTMVPNGGMTNCSVDPQGWLIYAYNADGVIYVSGAPDDSASVCAGDGVFQGSC